MTTELSILNNRYHLQEKLGAGAFANVFRARDQLLERNVAVKLLDRYLVEKEGPALGQQFISEAKAVSKLSHPHIVHIYDMGQEGWQLYLVMEYLPGGDLAARLAQHGPYDLPVALALLQPVAHALDHAHAAGMVHRDVKPQNILFAADNRPILTDFGLVKVLSGTMVASSPAFSGGKLLGTPEYMAPEQAQSRPVDARADVYALAVVTYQLLTGQVPFKGDTAMSTLFLAVSTPREQLAPYLPPPLPAAARDILLAGLAVNPADRPAGPGAFLQALQAAGAQEPAPAVTASHEGKKEPAVAVTAAEAQDKGTVSLPYIISGRPPLIFDWCLVPAGAFTMGGGSEKHTVTLPDYYLARFPTTNAQYRLFIEAGGYNQKEWWTSYGWAWREKKKITRPAHWNDKKWNAPNLPVVGVSWYEAAAFCAWAASASGEAIRLPTEAEWEKGARGTDQRPYPWGSQQPDNTRCNSNKNVGQTTPLGRNSPQGDSPYGCADMSGNVWEWCRSEYRAYPYRADDGRESLPGTANRALRGGSWGSIDDCVRAASRLSYLPAFRSFNIGFRCAQE